jgi:hypothetical protein
MEACLAAVVFDCFHTAEMMVQEKNDQQETNSDMRLERPMCLAICVLRSNNSLTRTETPFVGTCEPKHQQNFNATANEPDEHRTKQ